MSKWYFWYSKDTLDRFSWNESTVVTVIVMDEDLLGSGYCTHGFWMVTVHMSSGWSTVHMGSGWCCSAPLKIDKNM